MRGLQRLCTSVRQAANSTGLQQLAMPSLQHAVPWGQGAALPSCALQASSWLPCIASSRVSIKPPPGPAFLMSLHCLPCMHAVARVCTPRASRVLLAALLRLAKHQSTGAVCRPMHCSCPCTIQGQCVDHCICPVLPCRASAAAPLLLSQHRGRAPQRGHSSILSPFRQTQGACLLWRAPLVSMVQIGQGKHASNAV